jgi:phosphatidylglycerol---prolipoprotein diacylglyceryl transferase
MIDWWQHLPSHMDPTIFTIGNFPLRWYGTMYILAFFTSFLVVSYIIKKEKLPYNADFISDAFTWGIIGVLLGGRFGYVLFYGFDSFIHDPISIIMPFKKIYGEWRFTGISGMSYHGGVSGVMIAWALYARKHKMPFLKLTDLFVAGNALGFTWGRIGNFINGELYGRITNSSIGMYFPNAGDGLLRHPSQLYEGFFEGFALFVILWFVRKKITSTGFLSGLYIFGYGFFRFFIEYFRQPDAHLGFVFMNFSMGQMLCLAMMMGAVIIWIYSKKEYGLTIQK